MLNYERTLVSLFRHRWSAINGDGEAKGLKVAQDFFGYDLILTHFATVKTKMHFFSGYSQNAKVVNKNFACVTLVE